MDKELLKSYADLMAEIAKLLEKKEEMQTAIIDALQSDGRREYNSKFGKFEISGRRTYSYSPKVKELQDIVYKQKKEEEKSGVAELTRDSTFVRFTPIKEALNG